MWSKKKEPSLDLANAKPIPVRINSLQDSSTKHTYFENGAMRVGTKTFGCSIVPLQTHHFADDNRGDKWVVQWSHVVHAGVTVVGIFTRTTEEGYPIGGV